MVMMMKNPMNFRHFVTNNHTHSLLMIIDSLELDSLELIIHYFSLENMKMCVKIDNMFRRRHASENL